MASTEESRIRNLFRRYRYFIGRDRHGARVLAMVLITLAVYAYMLLVSIPGVMAHAGGMKLFDMLPTGYSPEYARQLLESLGPGGRAAYLERQIPVDMVYPALFAVSYALLLAWVARKASRASEPVLSGRVVALSLIPMAAGLFDYLENFGIAAMILSFPEVSSGVVRAASAFSVTKAMLTTAYFAILIVAGLLALVRRAQRGR